MHNELIHKKLIRRSENLIVVDNLYDDSTFSNYYQVVMNQDEILGNDFDIYKNHFKSMAILEIGSGTGRVFNRLFIEGYNIYGIEPSIEMSKYILNEGRDRVYPLTLQQIDQFPIHDINIVIIPATSISLFSHKDFEEFLEYLIKKQTSINRIIFDFLNDDFFTQSMDIIHSHTIGSDKFYSVNFFDSSKDRIIYNLVNSEKIGISIKYAYSLEKIVSIFKKFGMTLNIITNTDSYVMVEGIFNDE